MKNFIIYLAVTLSVFCSKLQAQDAKIDSKNQQKIILKKIDSITKS